MLIKSHESSYWDCSFGKEAGSARNSKGSAQKTPKVLEKFFWFGLVRIRPLRSVLTTSESWDEGDGFQ